MKVVIKYLCPLFFLYEVLSVAPLQGESYDFIVVGSGSAGSVIANRLSENTNWTVLLLEAGRKELKLFEIPMATLLAPLTPYNWHYLMEYEPGIARGFQKDRMTWPRGKALGGTTTINNMIYTRGHKFDYDRWEKAGNPGWSWEDVLPYFIKSENSGLEHSEPAYHGYDGYLGVENGYNSPITDSFINGSMELGLPYSDCNANLELQCVSRIQGTLLRGRRHSVARAFLDPVKHRPNLVIKTSAYVTKVLIENKKAYGVTYSKSDQDFVATAKKEVILSAGSFNSPQLLMLAGIGPKKHLEELNIRVIKDLPVGQNLQDHLTFVGLAYTVNDSVALTLPKALAPSSWWDFLKNGKGPLTCLGGAEAIAYIKTETRKETENMPDVELLFIGMTLAKDWGQFQARSMGFKSSVFRSLFGPLLFRDAWMIFPVLLHPKSSGYVKLKSSDPFEYPLLHGNFFSDPHDDDINTFLTAIRYIQKLSKTEAFQKYKSELNPNEVPDCKHLEFDSDDYWRCCIRSVTYTFHHQVGTAKMGPEDDPSSVVNHELKVHGIERLRVADTSVIPFALGAHTNAPTIMVGEKASDIIKEYWLREEAI